MLREIFNKRDDFLIIAIYNNDCQRINSKFKFKLLIIDIDDDKNDEFREHVIRERRERIKILNLFEQF